MQTEFLVAAAVLAIAGGAVYFWYRNRPAAEELERRRRQQIALHGKMGDGMITDVQEGLISYSYHVRGIEYLTSQDVSALRDRLAADLWGFIGPVGIKYDPRNPANSIVISEEWSGIRK